jgi:hypothetical protein
MTFSSLSIDQAMLSVKNHFCYEEIDTTKRKVGEMIDVTKRQVKFSEMVLVRSTIHLNDMTEEEITRSWFTRKEMHEIRKFIIFELKFLSSGLDLPGTSLRGLEYKSGKGAMKKKLNRERALDAVLDEQDLQSLSMICDPENLRNVYLEVSQQCQIEAHELAMTDEQEIKLMESEILQHVPFKNGIL